MHTLEQARQLWCPMARTEGCCIAEKCAMWRWVDRKPKRRKITAFPHTATKEEEAKRPSGAEGFDFLPYDEEDGDPAEWIEPQEMADARRLGCCGLAGVPAQ